MEFSKCFDKWRRLEKQFATMIIQKELDVLKLEFAPNKQFKDWDLKITSEQDGEIKETTYEVKSDDKSLETWNICFEYYYNWEPSGIYASKADYIVYQIAWEFYIKPRAELLADLAVVEKKNVDGGDGNRSKMFLISKEKFDLIFNKY